MHHSARSLFLLAGLLVLAACRDSSPVAYRIPKEHDETPPPAATQATTPSALPAGHPAMSEAATPAPGTSMADTQVIKADGPGLKWVAPARWHSKPASAMRKASYTVEGDAGATADVAITAFPGDVGGELANVNRWRGQMSLPPVNEADLASVVTRHEQNGLHLTIVDFANDSGQRMLAAMVPYNGATWFFKLTGPDALVAREKDTFLTFLGTIQAP